MPYSGETCILLGTKRTIKPYFQKRIKTSVFTLPHGREGERDILLSVWIMLLSESVYVLVLT